MKILYDYQIFSLQKYGGISRYFCKLIEELKKLDIDVDISGKYSSNYYFSETDFNDKKKFLGDLNFKGKKTIELNLNSKASLKQIGNKDFDIFHPTFYGDYFLKTVGDKPFVLTIVDMMDEIFKTDNKYQKQVIEQKKRLAEKASGIITISEHSKKDIVEILGLNPERIKVIYLGCNNDIIPQWNRDKLPEHYILFVGNRSWYKNFDFFFKSVKKILQEDVSLNLVCAGGDPFSLEEEIQFKESNLLNRIHQFNVSDEELYFLYSKALCFIFPSLYEGFGIPVLEAFINNCPAVLADRSSLPEVGKDAAVYFNPENKDSIYTSICSVIYNEALRNQMIRKSISVINDFSWKKCAFETLQCYKDITA